MMEYEVVEEIMYGLESGILFGMASIISNMGFLFLEQGFSPLLVPVCIAISISCSRTRFFYQTRGLKHGRAIVVSTYATVASIVTGVLAGMIALGERLPTSLVGRLSLLLGWLLIMVGVVLLMSSRWVIRLFPGPSRPPTRSGVGRSSNLRRSASAVRDSSPSAAIQAATLHHLISSAAKEKA
ncbi:hypothetical protein SAY86_007942 [Trapa natans]|uniref:Probable magnesium transporter n=1 Tax=Trapa natans TaxID=22666 RepID=A0AAN7L982_TRANT|nr:hypothetical protein SAY86_007942 [Trapa natans]